MSPALRTSLFVSVALAAFAGSAQAGSYKRLHLDSPLLGSAHDGITDYAGDADVATIAKAAKAAKAAMELIEDEDVVEELVGDLEE